MIWRPKVGQRVELRYGKKARAASAVLATLHGSRGVVSVAATGPGPIDALIYLDEGLPSGSPEVARSIIVPRGNLVAVKEIGQ